MLKDCLLLRTWTGSLSARLLALKQCLKYLVQCDFKHKRDQKCQIPSQHNALVLAMQNNAKVALLCDVTRFPKVWLIGLTETA